MHSTRQYMISSTGWVRVQVTGGGKTAAPHMECRERELVLGNPCTPPCCMPLRFFLRRGSVQPGMLQRRMAWCTLGRERRRKNASGHDRVALAHGGDGVLARHFLEVKVGAVFREDLRTSGHRRPRARAGTHEHGWRRDPSSPSLAGTNRLAREGMRAKQQQASLPTSRLWKADPEEQTIRMNQPAARHVPRPPA